MPLTNDAHTESSHFGKTVTIKGELQSQEDVFIDGKLEGVIRLGGRSLTVGPHGDVKADITAHEVIVHGKLRGNVEARDRIEIGRTGSVWGDLSMARISIQDGAFFQGKVDIRIPGERAAEARGAAAAPASRAAIAVSPAVESQPALLDQRS